MPSAQFDSPENSARSGGDGRGFTVGEGFMPCPTPAEATPPGVPKTKAERANSARSA